MYLINLIIPEIGFRLWTHHKTLGAKESYESSV